MNRLHKNDHLAVLWYLTILYGFSFGFALLEMIFQTGQFYTILQTGFTAFPVLTAIIVQKIVGEQGKIKLSLQVWKKPKAWIFSAFAPAITIVLGAVLYFVVFRGEYSGAFELGAFIGNDAHIEITNPLFFATVCVIISVVFVPVQLLELGEEVGWRGYLLWFQVEKYGEKKAVFMNGIEWGFAHLPLVYLGFNYSNDNPGAPWTNMIMMMLLCVVMGIIFSYITLRTENCMYAAIMHGVFNIIGEIPVFCSLSLKSGLLGPNPTGLLSMTFLILLSLFLFFRIGKDKNKAF